MWPKHSDDCLKHMGNVRVFVNLRDKDKNNNWDDGLDIISVETFSFGLITSENSYRTWIQEEIREDYNNHLRWKLKEELKLENGFYEVVGEFYYHGWTSGYYEPEYESIWDIRNTQHRKLTFDEAYNEAVIEAEGDEECLGCVTDVLACIEFGRYDCGRLFYHEPDETLYKKIVKEYGVTNSMDRHIDDRRKPDMKKATTEDLIKWTEDIILKPDYPEEFDELKEFLAERELLT